MKLSLISICEIKDSATCRGSSNEEDVDSSSATLESRLQAEYSQLVDGIGWKSADPPLFALSEDCVHVRLDFHSAGDDPRDKVLTDIRNMLDALAELSQRFSLQWTVGHELDPDLGRISNGSVSPELLEELEMATRLAATMKDIMDDEGELEVGGDSFPLDLGGQESWDGLFDTGETFTRFRDFD